MSISERKLEANRRNAEKSTGPRTAEGKARVARNAITHGLTAQFLVVDENEREVFRDFEAGLIEAFAPENAAEDLIVSQIIASAWKLRGVRKWETEQLRHLSKPDEPLGVTLFKWDNYKKVFAVSGQETRISNLMYRAMSKLERLQKERRTQKANPPFEPETDEVAQEAQVQQIAEAIEQQEIEQARTALGAVAQLGPSQTKPPRSYPATENLESQLQGVNPPLESEIHEIAPEGGFEGQDQDLARFIELKEIEQALAALTSGSYRKTDRAERQIQKTKPPFESETDRTATESQVQETRADETLYAESALSAESHKSTESEQPARDQEEDDPFVDPLTVYPYRTFPPFIRPKRRSEYE